MKIKLISWSHHRNGVCGAPFDVALFEDTDGSTKLFTDHGGENYAVLQVDKLAEGDIAFGSNSWRGDHYADELRKLIARGKCRPDVAPDAFFVRYVPA